MFLIHKIAMVKKLVITVIYRVTCDFGLGPEILRVNGLRNHLAHYI